MPPQARTTGTNEDLPQRGLRARSGSDSDFSEAESVASSRSYRTYRVRRSKLISMVNWMHVLGTHTPAIIIIGIGVLCAQIIHQVLNEVDPSHPNMSIDTVLAVAVAIQKLLHTLYQAIIVDTINGTGGALQLLSPAVKMTAVALFVGAWLVRKDNPVYLLSFATWKPPESWKLSHDQIIEIMRKKNCFNEQSLNFLRRILERSGTGQATAWPPGITKTLEEEVTDVGSADMSMKGSREEAETIIFSIVEDALRKAKVGPKDIDILIVNCSLFSPTPSLCAMIMSHFKMRSDVMTYNLSGMGCSASLISIDLAKQLLAGEHNSRAKKALVVSTEILTPNFYHGNDRGFLIQNTLFRCGGAAMVLSNSFWDGRHAWYKLLHTVRVQGSGHESYECVYETEDENGQRGVRLSKDIVKVAGKCMEKNMTILGPLVLPLQEQVKVVISMGIRFVFKKINKWLISQGKKDLALKYIPVVKQYVPDFKRGIDHFCIHAGGRAVIDGIEKNMKLEPYHSEASRMTLLNYGNTSSSSIWYELEYIQEQQKSNPMKKGDRIMQVAFGSGFKCTSGVWLKL